MNDIDLATARSLQGKLQRVGDITGLHVGTQLPGNDIAGIIIMDSTEIEPAPANDLQIGKVSLPLLIDGGCLSLNSLATLMTMNAGLVIRSIALSSR